MLHQKKAPPEEQQDEIETFYIPSDTLSEKEVKNLSKQQKGKVFAAVRGGPLYLYPPDEKSSQSKTETEASVINDPIFFIKL